MRNIIYLDKYVDENWYIKNFTKNKEICELFLFPVNLLKDEFGDKVTREHLGGTLSMILKKIHHSSDKQKFIENIVHILMLMDTRKNKQIYQLVTTLINYNWDLTFIKDDLEKWIDSKLFENINFWSDNIQEWLILLYGQNFTDQWREDIMNEFHNKFPDWIK